MTNTNLIIRNQPQLILKRQRYTRDRPSFSVDKIPARYFVITWKQDRKNVGGRLKCVVAMRYVQIMNRARILDGSLICFG
jgi:hypothetical protein